MAGRILLGLALTVAAAASGVSASVQTARGAGSPRLTAPALYAASLPLATVLSAAGKGYWPELPGFDTTIDEEDPQPVAALNQSYTQLGGKARIVTHLYAYPSPEAALEYLQSAAIVVGQIDQDSPAIGDQHVYYVTTLTSGEPSTRFTFIHGSVGAQIQVDGARWSRARIARLGIPLDARIGQLLGGQLKLPVVPQEQLDRLPPAAAAPGPMVGTALVPAESWALAVHKGSPTGLRARLAASGNATFPFRRYLRKGSRADVLEVALFSFPNAAAAKAWAAPFLAGVTAHPADALDPGATGGSSAYRLQLENYELQFVAGRYVADVFCYAPFVSTVSAACEDATRSLGEAWYRELG